MRRLLFAFILVAITNALHAQERQHKDSLPDPPLVEIVSQPDSPLRISSVQTKWAGFNNDGIELFIVVENVSGKRVSSYATRDDGGGEVGASCFLLSAKSPGKALRPGQSEGRSTWRFYTPSASAPLRRLVDFVEFTDRTTWGADSCQSAESLSGWRAGALEARKLLRELFASGGPEAVVDSLKSESPRADPPPDRSHVWQLGFRSGFSSYLDKVRQADQEWGYTEIEYALRRPVDALEEKEP